MQTTNATFDNAVNSQTREISWQLRMSFDKAFDPSVTFFTLDVSLLDGPDILAPSDGNVVQEWDKYAYTDYSDRVISIEITREEIEPYSVVQAFADITLNNYDSYFTPNSGSPIDEFILPKRPVRLLLGFEGYNLPQFIGLTERMPEIDKTARTVRFHLTDFLSFLFSKKIDNTELLTDVSTGEALTYLFESVGLSDDQLNFTGTSFNRIPYFFVEKDQTLGDVVRKLMEAEQGRLYMDEFGVITFQNRQDYSTTPIATFDMSNTLDYSTSGEDDLINFVEIKSSILEEQIEQSIWQSSSATLVKAGATATVWADLQDPVTSVTSPIYSDVTIPQSHFISAEDTGNTIPYTSISLDSIDVFSKSVKMVFENTGSNDAYVTTVDLWGTPIKVTDTIRVEDFDQGSVDKYEEQRYTLDTTYIQKRSTAESKASILLDDYAELGSILEIDVIGNMALQIGDHVTLDLDGYQGDYAITKITQVMQGAGYRQRLTVKEKEVRMYFILDQSLLDGPDVLAP